MDATPNDTVASTGVALRVCMDCKDPKSLEDGVKCRSCLREQDAIVGGCDESDPWYLRVYASHRWWSEPPLQRR